MFSKERISNLLMSFAVSLVVSGSLLWGYESARNEHLYNNQVSACQSLKTVQTIIHDFLFTAIQARLKAPVDKQDAIVAGQLTRIDNRIWPILSCDITVRRP